MMDTIRIRSLRCDTPGCDAVHGPHDDLTAGEVRRRAKADGWGVSGNEDRCPTHRNPRRKTDR